MAQSVCAPLRECDGIEVDFLTLQPAQPFPFPWPFLGFFRIFPETVLMKPQPLLPLAVDADKRYDLVILAYQVWFLSPSLPCTSFLASPEAARLLKDTPVVTLIGCRNMWLMAQEKVKARPRRVTEALRYPADAAMPAVAAAAWRHSGGRLRRRL
ncbi:hypothetical protein ACNFCJ_04890 [Pseudomonas sp. NY15364]|uniref:hypothetical protein n=1 Tax=Pseudomonas sp. NY15364 TaxID=3400353 RepID=UPI003A85C0E1